VRFACPKDRWCDSPTRSALRSRRGISRARGLGHAFTLVEAIVVIVILTVLAGAIAPRLVSMSSRRARNNVNAIADLLGSAASRQELTSGRLAVSYDGETRVLTVLSLKATSGDSLHAGSTMWVQDVAISPVHVEDVEDKSVTFDFIPQDSKRWRMELQRARQRPALAIELTEPETGDLWHVILGAGAMRATVVAPGEALPQDMEVDLDRTRGSGDVW